MQKDSIIKPLCEYLEGPVDIETAKERMIIKTLNSAYKPDHKFLDSSKNNMV